jgi:hypothetical protein
MVKNEKLLDADSLVPLVMGTVVTVAVGFLFIGQRTFHISFIDSPFLSIGIGGSLVYVVHKAWGNVRALGIALLLSIVNAGLAQGDFFRVWLQTLLLLAMVVLLCHYLTAWKINKPVFGRLILLGLPCAVALGLETLIFRLISGNEYALVAAGNNTMHGLALGVGLGIGLELGELVVRLVRRRQAGAKLA